MVIYTNKLRNVCRFFDRLKVFLDFAECAPFKNCCFIVLKVILCARFYQFLQLFEFYCIFQRFRFLSSLHRVMTFDEVWKVARVPWRQCSAVLSNSRNESFNKFPEPIIPLIYKFIYIAIAIGIERLSCDCFVKSISVRSFVGEFVAWCFNVSRRNRLW